MGKPHETYIEAVRWGYGAPELFDVGCTRCGFSSCDHPTFEAATRVADEHEAVTPVPWPWGWHGKS